MVVWFGGTSGLLSWIPIYEHEDQMELIQKGINFMPSIAAVVKPHFERLFNVIGDKAEIFAVPGIADYENIKAIKTDLDSAYRHKHEWLQSEFAKRNLSMKTTKDAIKEAEHSRDVLKKYLEKHPNDQRALKEYKNAERTIKLNKAEYADLKEHAEMLKVLMEEYMRGLNKDKLESTIKTLTKLRKEENAKLEKLDNSNGGSAEYYHVLSNIKAISNLLRAAKKRLIELGNLELSSSPSGPESIIEFFTHNVRMKPETAKITKQLAKIDYFSFVKDVDRNHNINVVENDITVIPKKLNGFEFNIVLKGVPNLGVSTKTYSVNSNTKVVENFYNSIESVGDREVLKKPLTLLMSGGHIFTSFSVEPTFDLDSSHLLVSLAKGPFADRESLGGMLRKMVVTRTTKEIEKLPLDSSASIIDIYPNGEFSHTLLTSNLLKIKRIESDKEELPIANKLIEEKVKKKAENGKASSNEEKAIEENIANAEKIVKDEKLDMLRMQQRRPSELKDYEAKSLSVKQILGLISHASEKIPTDITKIGAVAYSDVHWGGWAQVDLLDTAVKLGKKYFHNLDDSKIPILLLNGDMIEGNLANFKNQPAKRTLPNTPEEYKAYLEKRGLSQEEIYKELYKMHQNVSIIETISAQAETLVERMLPVIDEVISKNGYIIIVSGNHFNNTVRGHEWDEATELEGRIKSYLKGKGVGEDRVIVVTGEEYGIGNIPIGDTENTIRVQHKLARALEKKPKAISLKRVPTAAVFESHYHEARETASGDLQTFETVSMQYEDENTYVSEFPQAISNATRGFIIVEAEFKDNKTIKSTYTPILRANLERNGELERSLYEDFRKETFTIKAPQQKEKVK